MRPAHGSYDWWFEVAEIAVRNSPQCEGLGPLDCHDMAMAAVRSPVPLDALVAKAHELTAPRFTP